MEDLRTMSETSDPNAPRTGRQTRVLADGIHFGEGPRWHDGRLWFSDFHAHAVKSCSLASDCRIEFTIDDRPSGLGWMPDGSMLIVSMHNRQVLRRTADGTIAVHADLNDVAGWHCNDMVVDAKGRAYVGNFGFDMDRMIAEIGPEAMLADHPRGKLAFVDTDGSVSVAAEDMDFSNGTVITPDGRTLIIGESLGGKLTAFDIADDGKLSNRRLWADIRPRHPDGNCLDAEGAIWIANPGAPECVRIAEGGRVLEVIDTGDPCYACMLGGEDGKSLFILTTAIWDDAERAVNATGRLLVAEVDVPHAGLP